MQPQIVVVPLLNEGILKEEKEQKFSTSSSINYEFGFLRDFVLTDRTTPHFAEFSSGGSSRSDD